MAKNSLPAVKCRSEPSTSSDLVGFRKYTFASLKIFQAYACNVEGMPPELASPVMCMAVKCIYAKREVCTLYLRPNRWAVVCRDWEAASNIVADKHVRTKNLYQSLSNCEWIFCPANDLSNRWKDSNINSKFYFCMSIDIPLISVLMSIYMENLLNITHSLNAS